MFIELGETTTLEAALADGALLWLEVAVDGTADSAPSDTTIDSSDIDTSDAGDTASAAVHPALEILSASGRMRGGSLVMEVELGHPLGKGKAQAGGLTLEGNAAIKP